MQAFICHVCLLNIWKVKLEPWIGWGGDPNHILVPPIAVHWATIDANSMALTTGVDHAWGAVSIRRGTGEPEGPRVLWAPPTLPLVALFNNPRNHSPKPAPVDSHRQKHHRV